MLINNIASNIADYPEILSAILLNNQHYCHQYCWISHIASNISSNIAGNIADSAILPEKLPAILPAILIQVLYVIFARNGDVVFLSLKLKYHEFDQRLFWFIKNETDWQTNLIKKVVRIIVFIHLRSTLNPSPVPFMTIMTSLISNMT